MARSLLIQAQGLSQEARPVFSITSDLAAALSVPSVPAKVAPIDPETFRSLVNTARSEAPSRAANDRIPPIPAEDQSAPPRSADNASK